VVDASPFVDEFRVFRPALGESHAVGLLSVGVLDVAVEDHKLPELPNWATNDIDT